MKDSDTNAHLTTFTDEQFWIGLHEPKKYVWKWTDGSMFSRINDFHNWLTERKSFYGVACATVEGSGAGVVYWQKKDVKRNTLLCVKLQKRKSVSSSQKSNPQNLMHMNSHPRNPKCIVECNFQKKLHHAVSACCIRIVY